MFVWVFFQDFNFFYSFFFSEADDLYSDLVLEVVQDNNIVFRKKVSKKLTLENTEGAIRNGRSREVSNVLGTQEKQKQNKNQSQYVLDTTIHKQTQIT